MVAIMSSRCCSSAERLTFRPSLISTAGRLVAAEHHVPVPAYLVVERIGAGLFFGKTAAVGIDDVNLVELPRSVAADHQVDPRIQAALRHQGDACCKGGFMQVLQRVGIIGAHQRDPGFDGRLKSQRHELDRKQINGRVRSILEDSGNVLLGGAVHFDHLDLAPVDEPLQPA